MNGTERKFTQEYVELKTSLEQIRTKIENIEILLREYPKVLTELRSQINNNRSDLSSIKGSAIVFGGLAGSLFALATRYLFFQ